MNARAIRSKAAWSMAALALAVVMFAVIDILALVAGKGAAALNGSLFTTMTTGIAGGLQNAIYGTFALVGLGIVLSVPIGVLAGVYGALFAPDPVAKFFRFVAEVMAGVPSIVIGYFGYTMLVVAWGFGFSLLAGGISLAILMLPYIVRATESTIRQLPHGYMEGARALGITPADAFRTILWKPALPGVLTGVLLAISIGLGETAPLLYTAGWSNFDPNWQLTKNPIGYLTYVVWTYLNEPYSAAHRLAYAAALLLTALVLLLHVAAKGLQRSTPSQ